MNQIEIYLKNNTNYESNGDITLFPTSCTYKDSEQEVTLEHPLDDEGRWKFIDYENMLSVEENGKRKFFRIYNVVKSLYNITAYARPPFYDLIDTILLDVRPTNKNGQEAMDIILKDTGFTGHSNISTINTSYFVRKNIVNSLVGDDENSFINRWGGEFYTENFDVYINDIIGSDNGLRVEFGYNLEEVEQDINIEEVVTRIIPIGFNGIMLEGDTPWVDSALISNYTHPKSRVIEFSDVKVKEKEEDQEGFNTIEEARAELIKRCNKMFDEGIDKPLVNYKISMINIENSTEYEDVKKLVKANKGDIVTCYIPYLDISVKIRVIDFEKDMIKGEYLNIELGNIINNYIKNQADVQSKVNNINNALNGDGTIKADKLIGTINALETRFHAIKDDIQQQDIIAMLTEDRMANSPNFGAIAISTMGILRASQFKPNTQEWDFKILATGKGLRGLLKSVNDKTWINLDDGTFNLADIIKYDGNTATYDFGNTDVAKQSDIDNAKAEIRKDYQNAKVSINSANGIVAKEGAFTLTNSQGTIIIDGQSNIHKIIKEGTATIQYRGQSITVTVAHNLGYKPAFSAYQMGLDNANEYSILPYSKWTNADGEIAQIRARADNNNLYFDFLAKTGSNIGNLDIKIKYFIYKETVF